MKKLMSCLFLIIVGAAVGFGLSWVFYQDKITDSNEDIVSAEIALLNEAANQTPDCSALSAGSGIYVSEHNNLIFVWRKLEKAQEIEKIAINEDRLAVSELIKNPC